MRTGLLPSFSEPLTGESPYDIDDRNDISSSTCTLWSYTAPGGDVEDVPEEERLEKFREVRDEIEQKILNWLERPEEELEKLRD